MITADEMRKLLFDEFGISSDQQLDEELKKLGSIRIGIFIDEPIRTHSKKEGESNVYDMSSVTLSPTMP